MKNIFKILSIIGLLVMSACETTELDLRENPNNLSAGQEDLDLVLNNIQLEFVDFLDGTGGQGDGFGRIGAELCRIDYMFGRNYTNAYGPAGFDDEWTTAYADMLSDIRLLTPSAEEQELFVHIGIAKTLEAFTLVTLVDFFGDVPYTEAVSEEFPNPLRDSGADVYASALTLLDEAIANFNLEASTLPAIDFYYNNDVSKWIKAANTIKMKIYLQSRLVDSGAMASFNAIVDSGNYITSSSDDFQFGAWGTNEVQPDVRHPRYTESYTVNGGIDYMSNWLMNTMLEDNDPRIRYYFYRQVSETPNNDNPNEQTLQCSVQSVPAHYQNTPFADIWCSLPNGYWGRIHGSNEGIPPDGFLRTLTGVYPAGGAFDDSRFESLGQGDGAAGAGAITPIILASTVDFYKAEMAMANGDMGSAKTFMLDGLQKSVAKVTTFASNDPTADLSFEPTAEDIADHAADVAARFDDADTDEDRWNVLAEQFFVNLYGNGIDGYNFYRRTGYPTTVAPNVEPNPGAFIRSLFYPANHVNNNINVTQKESVTQQVFWDNNPASPGFPEQN